MPPCVLLGFVLALAWLGAGCVRRPAVRGEGWYSVRTRNLVVETDGAPAVAVEVAWNLEDLYRALQRAYPSCTATGGLGQTDITMLARRDDFDAFGAHGELAAFYSPEVHSLAYLGPRIVAYAGERNFLEQTLIHEVTHRFTAACFPDAPVWLNEGLSEYFETIVVREHDIVVGRSPFVFGSTGEVSGFVGNGRVIHAVPRSLVPSLPELLAMGPPAFYATDGGLAARTARYAGAWALVHLQLLGPRDELRNDFHRYLAALAAGTPRPSEAVARLHDRDYAAYLERGDLLERRLRYDPPAIPEPVAARLEPAEAHLRLAELTMRGSARRGRTCSGPVDAHLSRALEDPSWRALALVYVAECAESAQQAELLREAEDAVRALPLWGAADVRRARAWHARSAPSSAEATAAIEALRADPHRRDADRYVLGLLLVARADAAGAEIEGRAIIERDRSAWTGHLVLALALTMRGAYDEARRELVRVENLAAHHDTSTVRAAQALAAAIDADLAARRAEPAAAGEPDDTSAAGHEPSTGDPPRALDTPLLDASAPEATPGEPGTTTEEPVAPDAP